MKRPLCLILGLAALAACHTSTTSQPTGGGGSGDDASSGGGCPCQVVVSSADGGNKTRGTVECGQTACVGGVEVLCSGGTPEQVSHECVEDGGGGEACVPSCPAHVCGGQDGCGGVCMCPTGEKCIAGLCGNGCGQTAGDVCETQQSDAGSNTCCAVGYRCVPGEGGTVCCAETTAVDASVAGAPSCLSDEDCCDAPQVHCKAATHVCQP